MTRSLSAWAVFATAALALTGCAAQAPAGPAAATARSGITARGLGVVTGTPDLVTVSLGVQTRGPSAKGALDANNGSSTALIEVLKSRGVAAADLRTNGLSVNPTFGTDGRITGYEVTNQVTATLRDIAAAGGLIDAAAEAAGDGIRVQQLAFSIDDDSALRAQARAEAVRQAQAQAVQLAEAAGVALGPIHSIVEVPAAGAPGPLREFQQADAAAAPLEPGGQELGVTVEVVYAIDQ